MGAAPDDRLPVAVRSLVLGLRPVERAGLGETHRLWIGTILVLGGLGVRWAARQLGLGAGAALVAGVVYQLSPYVLPLRAPEHR